MTTLKTVPDRIAECIERARVSGHAIERFHLGVSEMENLREFADKETFDQNFASGMPAVLLYQGHRIVAVKAASHFSAVLSHVEQLV